MKKKMLLSSLSSISSLLFLLPLLSLLKQSSSSSSLITAWTVGDEKYLKHCHGLLIDKPVQIFAVWPSLWWNLQNPLHRYHLQCDRPCGAIYRTLCTDIICSVTISVVPSTEPFAHISLAVGPSLWCHLQNPLHRYHLQCDHLCGSIYRTLCTDIICSGTVPVMKSTEPFAQISFAVGPSLWCHLQNPLHRYHLQWDRPCDATYRTLCTDIICSGTVPVMPSTEPFAQISFAVGPSLWWNLQNPLHRYHLQWDHPCDAIYRTLCTDIICSGTIPVMPSTELFAQLHCSYSTVGF